MITTSTSKSLFKKTTKPKKTSIGKSSNTHFVSRNDRNNKKAYRGQG